MIWRPPPFLFHWVLNLNKLKLVWFLFLANQIKLINFISNINCIFTGNTSDVWFKLNFEVAESNPVGRAARSGGERPGCATLGWPWWSGLRPLSAWWRPGGPRAALAIPWPAIQRSPHAWLHRESGHLESGKSVQPFPQRQRRRLGKIQTL